MIDRIYVPLPRRRGHRECSWCRFTCFLLSVMLVVPADLFARSAIPGEGQAGLFYTVTHLHPAAYIILFLVFVLSVANLVFRFGTSGLTRPVLHLLAFVRRDSDFVERLPVLKGLKRSSIGTPQPQTSGGHAKRVIGNSVPRDESVISVKKLEKSVQKPSASVIPTPLEGVNHVLPKLTEPSSRQSGSPRVRGSHPDQKPSAPEFKFSSAVDVPSPEEVERREKTHLVVTGCVLGADGKGIPAVIVYLTDEEGKRVGQSCRTMADTGEFKVLIGEPGKYRINGYKRGFIMEQSESPQVPIEAGKIEGFNFRMIPEGCLLSGRVVREDSGEGLPEHEVSCVCRAYNFSRSARTGSDGQFRISGVPVNSECFLEVRGKEGDLRITTDAFQTVQKKEMYSEIKIAGSAPEPPDEHEVSSATNQETAEAAETVTMSEQQPAANDSADQPENSELLSPEGSSASPAP